MRLPVTSVVGAARVQAEVELHERTIFRYMAYG